MDTIPKGHPCYNNASMALSIDELGLTIRAYNCLVKANIHYIGQLVVRSESDLLKIKNLGRKTFNEIQALLSDKYGLGFDVPCQVPLSDLEDVKEFFGLSEGVSPFKTVYAGIALPSSSVEKMNDASIISAIQGICRDAFAKAVAREITDVAKKLEALVSPESLKQSIPETSPETENVSFPAGQIRQVSVPLNCPQYLVDAFNIVSPDLLQNAADAISGVTLYPILKAALSDLAVRRLG